MKFKKKLVILCLLFSCLSLCFGNLHVCPDADSATEANLDKENKDKSKRVVIKFDTCLDGILVQSLWKWLLTLSCILIHFLQKWRVGEQTGLAALHWLGALWKYTII